MDKQAAQNLWRDILAFAAAEGECQGEGNSGEFTDETERERLDKEFIKAFAVMRESFVEATGWQPIIRRGDDTFHFAQWNKYWDKARRAHYDYFNLYVGQYNTAPEGEVSAEKLFPIPQGQWDFVSLEDVDFVLSNKAILTLINVKRAGVSEFFWEYPRGEILFV